MNPHVPDHRRIVSTFDVGFLRGLYREGRLNLRPEFQRNAIWPTAAKSYFIDTVLRGRPVPLLFLYRTASARSGMPGLAVVDGQQRLTALFDYIDDAFALSGPDIRDHRGLRFSQLPESQRTAILNYGLIAEELDGYRDAEIRDIYVRLNKYGVRLSPQELRQAKTSGKFRQVVTQLGSRAVWVDENVLSESKVRRLRAQEFAAELLILLAEGAPQDKKGSVDQYYAAYASQFPGKVALIKRLDESLKWVWKALAGQPRSPFRKPVGLYSLIGALNRLTESAKPISKVVVPHMGGERLGVFAQSLRAQIPSQVASRYLIAASRQTDNLAPRRTRIAILAEVLSGKNSEETRPDS